MPSAAESSHQRHRDHRAKQAADSDALSGSERWLRTDTVDAWRHSRMYEPARAFLHDKSYRWLTVGDGTFGLDSIRLRQLGFEHVLPSDIGGALLSEAVARGLIDTYAVENAEALSFADNSFDLVLCKESYHHFPRPAIALYEMLRVARVAVILVEPRDFVIDHGPVRAIGPRGILKGIRTWIRDRRNRPHPRLEREQLYLLGGEPVYEETGNFLYMLSSRELEKIAFGLDLPAIALKGLNDVYLSWGGCDRADTSSDSFNATLQQLEEIDRRTCGGRSATSMLMAILFKTPPPPQTKEFLDTHDFLFRDLPRNPYLRNG